MMASSSDSPRAPAPSATRLLALRVGSAVISAFALALYAIGLPRNTRLAYVVCRAPAACTSVQLTPEGAHALTSAGISVPGFVTAGMIVNLGASLVWFVVAAILFWRRSDLPIALLLAVQLVTQGATSPVQPLIDLNTAWAVPANGLLALNSILLFYVFALFPNGRFVPHWLGWLGLVWAALNVATLAPGLLAPIAGAFVPFICMMACVIGAQAYRYWRVSGPTERQQAKWVVLGIAATTGSLAVLALPTLFVPALGASDSLYQLTFGLGKPVIQLFGPIALTFALLRYRLYDIDVLINRALVYGLLTGTLAAIYFGAVVAAQAVAQAITGVRSLPPIAVVASTLLIAALFTPLRRRIQAGIDRRFYRRKYDAARTLADFGATLRTETDLAALTGHLIIAVEETMRPARVSLWLRESERHDAAPARQGTLERDDAFHSL